MDTHLIVICRKDKVNKQNEAPLAIKISQNYKSKKVSLGIKVNIDYWDFEGNRLKDETPNKEHIPVSYTHLEATACTYQH